MDNLYIHLTNYSINMHAQNFIANQNENEDNLGHKRSVTSVLTHI